MISKEQRNQMVGYWWAKAQDSLTSARRELEAGAYSFAMNRLYYAAFYGVCAALLDRNQSFRKHSGVRAAFHRQFIKTGLLDTQWADSTTNSLKIVRKEITFFSSPLSRNMWSSS